MGKLFSWLLGIFKPASSKLLDIVAGLTHGTIRGIVEAKNEPQKVRRYGASPERIKAIHENLASYRDHLAAARNGK